MSQLSRTAWEALYGTTGTVFPDNTTGEISEGDMRTFGKDASDSLFFKNDDSYTAAFPQVTAAGTDTYTATLSPAITAYVLGQKFQILFTNANTGAATLNLNSVGALAITKNGATALAAGDIAAGSIKILAYDGTRLQIVGDGANKQLLVNSATALTSGATIDLTAIKHTLTTAEVAITFTISYTGDDISIRVILNATSSTFTFPAGALCISEGVASGNNTAGLAGVSGDKYVITIKHWGSAEYTVVVKNEGQ